MRVGFKLFWASLFGAGAAFAAQRYQCTQVPAGVSGVVQHCFRHFPSELGEQERFLLSAKAGRLAVARWYVYSPVPAAFRPYQLVDLVSGTTLYEGTTGLGSSSFFDGALTLGSDGNSWVYYGHDHVWRAGAVASPTIERIEIAKEHRLYEKGYTFHLQHGIFPSPLAGHFMIPLCGKREPKVRWGICHLSETSGHLTQFQLYAEEIDMSWGTRWWKTSRLSPDHRLLAQYRDFPKPERLRVIDTLTGRLIYQGDFAGIAAISFGGSGQPLTLAARTGEVWFVEPLSGQVSAPVKPLRIKEGYVGGAFLLPGGKCYLLSAPTESGLQGKVGGRGTHWFLRSQDHRVVASTLSGGWEGECGLDQEGWQSDPSGEWLYLLTRGRCTGVHQVLKRIFVPLECGRR